MRGASPWGLCTSCFSSSCRIITPWGFLMTCRDYLAPGVMILLVRMAGILIPLDKGRLRLLVAGSENKSRSSDSKSTASQNITAFREHFPPTTAREVLCLGAKARPSFPCGKGHFYRTAPRGNRSLSEGAELKNEEYRSGEQEEECLGSRTFSQQLWGHHSLGFSFNGFRAVHAS